MNKIDTIEGLIARFISFLFYNKYLLGISVKENKELAKIFEKEVHEKDFSIKKFIKKIISDTENEVFHRMKTDKTLNEKIKVVYLLIHRLYSKEQDVLKSKKFLKILNSINFNNEIAKKDLNYLLYYFYPAAISAKLNEESINKIDSTINEIFKKVYGDNNLLSEMFSLLSYFSGRQQESSAFDMDIKQMNIKEYKNDIPTARIMQKMESLTKQIDDIKTRDNSYKETYFKELLDAMFTIHSKHSISHFIYNEKSNIPLFYYRDEKGEHYKYVDSMKSFKSKCNENNDKRFGMNFYKIFEKLYNIRKEQQEQQEQQEQKKQEKENNETNEPIKTLSNFVKCLIEVLKKQDYPTEYCLSIMLCCEGIEDIEKQFCSIGRDSTIFKSINSKYQGYKNNKLISSIKKFLDNNENKFDQFCECRNGYYLKELIENYEYDDNYKHIDNCPEEELNKFIECFFAKYNYIFNTVEIKINKKENNNFINKTGLCDDEFDKRLFATIERQNFFNKSATNLLKTKKTIERIINGEKVKKEEAKKILKKLNNTNNKKNINNENWHDFYYIKAKIEFASKKEIRIPEYFNDLPKKYLNGEGYDENDLIDAKICNETLINDKRYFSVKISEPETVFKISIPKDYSLFKFFEISNRYNLFEATLIANKNEKNIIEAGLFSIDGILDKNTTLTESSKETLNKINTKIFTSIDTYLNNNYYKNLNDANLSLKTKQSIVH